MQIITICGMIGADKNKAIYEVDTALQEDLKLTKRAYHNMLPLLADAYSEHTIVALATPKAEEIQKKVLEKEQNGNNVTFKNIDDSHDNYEELFATILELLKDDQETIIDLSHGFRHIPLLMLISMIVHHLSDEHSIVHILFAKEVKSFEEYKVVDLVQYLDLAAVSYALASFNDNYTVAKSIKLRTPSYQNLLSILHKFSDHILANSLRIIFDEKLPKKIYDEIDDIKKSDEKIASLSLLSSVQLHLSNLIRIGDLNISRRYYELALLLFKKGYMLNAITILNEALPLYVFERFCSLNISTKSQAEYDYNYSKAIIDFIKGTENNKLITLPHKYFWRANIDIFERLETLLDNIRKIRNDLAHAHGSQAKEDISKQFEDLIQEYGTLIVKEDILQALKLDIKEVTIYEKYDKEKFNALVMQIFRRMNANKVIGFESFDTTRINRILNNDIPAVWNIKTPLLSEQRNVLKLMLEYFQAQKRIEKDKLIDRVYQEFSQYIK